MTHQSPSKKGQSQSGSNRSLWITLGLAVLLGLSSFLYEPHGYFEVEHIKGFYALFGFIALCVLFIAAKIASPLLTRHEDYYAPKDTLSEEFPENQLGRENKDV